MKRVQTTTSVKQPMLSPPKQIPIKAILFNATSDHFFDSEMKKKTCLKQQLQNFIQRRNAKKHKEQFIKNNCLSDYLTFFPYHLFEKRLRTQFKCFLKTVLCNIKWPQLLVYWALQYTTFSAHDIYQWLLPSFCDLSEIFFIVHFLHLRYMQNNYISLPKFKNRKQRDTSFMLLIPFHINFYSSLNIVLIQLE